MEETVQECDPGWCKQWLVVPPLEKKRERKQEGKLYSLKLMKTRLRVQTMLRQMLNVQALLFLSILMPPNRFLLMICMYVKIHITQTPTTYITYTHHTLYMYLTHHTPHTLHVPHTPHTHHTHTIHTQTTHTHNTHIIFTHIT